jgi:hypothetical protein
MFSPPERNEIIGALERWARDAPDEPVFGFLQGGRLFTPRELVKEVALDTPNGKALMEIIEHAARRLGFRDVIQRLLDQRAKT